MKVAIMQPTYLPWVGYFDLMEQVDAFVFLDNVEFSRQSWQQRNRIRAPQDLFWLTVPVLRKGKSHQKLMDVEISKIADFPRGHIKTIEQNYKKTPYFSTFFPELESLLEDAFSRGNLSELNQSLIRWSAKHLQIQTPLYRCSELNIEGVRSSLLVSICRHFQSTEYVSPIGSVEYLVEDHGVFKDAGVEVEIQNYTHPVYRQFYQPFIPYACILDILFNEGAKNAASIIRSGRKKNLSLGEAKELLSSTHMNTTQA